ncbi:hypothetical protein ASPSYDRAFT_50516 [Aspergillus sydowii CBS 593.65]|uniref:Clr5 domain-containing protein n=1 Tax=Aspergillus sydowii CBS 593.65 TaxID=1036612 RepID=A0A1L9T2U5_9EURO|nr:uncharacterized protein ASPSYDRAFT_50516 [Aspergillus sydowii CBS 593.65]OJJ53762.1 hypothetical protein ASPSYDRAFT_50516 [Aspergillus sydowii CBS 593.65]
MSHKAARIPDQIWNQHKETIIPFYKATSLPRTMKYMTEQHGFRATYEFHYILLEP